MPDVFVPQKVKKSEESHKVDTKEPIFPDGNVGLFSSFVENPVNVSFHHQNKDEKILLFLRGHFLVNLKWIILSILFSLLPIIVLVVGFENLPFLELPQRFTFVLVLAYYLFLFSFILVNFLMWYYNILLVTQIRVIDIDFVELLFHDVAETRFNLIQDVNYTQTGTLRHLFNYGDVFAQTAGGKENIEALGVPRPAKVVDFITSFIGKGYQHGGV